LRVNQANFKFITFPFLALKQKTFIFLTAASDLILLLYIYYYAVLFILL
jgi:hypothetical protein